jgi:nicotinate-nucleotide adenylyltransferase
VTPPRGLLNRTAGAAEDLQVEHRREGRRRRWEDAQVTEPDDIPSRGVRRVGVMGGTFDPVHNGHLVAASEVQSLFALDEVVFVPTGIPWQKSDEAVSPAEDRYLMTVIATASNPRFSVSRADIDRNGPTYTIDTLRDLHTEYGKQGQDVEMFFITGADALAQILSWKDADELFALAHFIGVTRRVLYL